MKMNLRSILCCGVMTALLVTSTSPAFSQESSLCRDKACSREIQRSTPSPTPTATPTPTPTPPSSDGKVGTGCAEVLAEAYVDCMQTQATGIPVLDQGLGIALMPVGTVAACADIAIEVGGWLCDAIGL